MIKKITQFAKNPVVLGSTVIFIGSNISNFIHFLFNLFMSRNLTVSDYGTMAALTSLVALTGIFSSALMPTIIKFAAEHFANNEHEKARALLIKVTQFSVAFGAGVLLIFFIFQQQISLFFNLPHDQILIMLSGFIALGSLLFTANLTFLQAKLSFNYMSFITFLSAIVKLVLGVSFVLLGFHVMGALFGILISLIIPYIVSFYPLRFIFTKGKNIVKLNIKELIAYGGPAALSTFSLTSLMSVDVILAKHFFDPKVAGLYAGLSLVGKVIYFFSLPIGSTMFPIIVQKYARKENYTGIFFLSIILLLLCCFGFTLLYVFFPNYVILFFLKRQEYYAIANLLGVMGLLISVFSVLSLCVNFFLSIKKTNIFIPLIIGAIAQIVFIWIFHATFLQVLLVSLIDMSILLGILLLYYFFAIYGRND